MLAYDVLCEGLACFPGDARLRQLQGLALARSGSPERANSILEKLYVEGRDDEETVGILARTNKSLALSVQNRHHPKELVFLQRSFELYSEAYDRFGGYWTGDERRHAGLAARRHGTGNGLSRPNSRAVPA